MGKDIRTKVLEKYVVERLKGFFNLPFLFSCTFIQNGMLLRKWCTEVMVKLNSITLEISSHSRGPHVSQLVYNTEIETDSVLFLLYLSDFVFSERQHSQSFSSH